MNLHCEYEQSWLTQKYPHNHFQHVRSWRGNARDYNSVKHTTTSQVHKKSGKTVMHKTTLYLSRYVPHDGWLESRAVREFMFSFHFYSQPVCW